MNGPASMVAPAARTARPRRAFTLVEVSITTAIIVVIVGATVAALSNVGVGRARSAWSEAAAEVGQRLITEVVAINAYESMSNGEVVLPSPCPDTPGRSCVPVRGQQTQVRWDFDPSPDQVAGGWASAWVDVYATFEPAVGSTLSDVEVTRRVAAGDVTSGTNRATVTVRADGPAQAVTTSPESLPPVHLIRETAAGTWSRVGPSVPFRPDGTAVIPVTDAAADCTSAEPCRVGIADGPDGFWATDQYTLTARDAVNEVGLIEVEPEQNLEVAVVFADRADIRIQILARPDGGEPVAGAEPNSVCLWAEFSDAQRVVTEAYCNDIAAGRFVAIRDYAPVTDPASPYAGRRLPIPANTPVTVLSDQRDGSCPALSPDTPVAARADGSWTPAAVCTTWTWGRPTEFVDRQTDGRSRIVSSWPEIATVEATPGSVVEYDLIWSSNEARPATGYPGQATAFADQIALNQGLLHAPLNEPDGEIVLENILTPSDPGAGWGTVSTEAGTALGVPGALDDDTTGAILDDVFAPALLFDANVGWADAGNVVAPQVIRTARSGWFSLYASVPQNATAELLSYGVPATDGWALRANTTEGLNAVELVIGNGANPPTILRSERGVVAANIWQMTSVRVRRAGAQVTADFWVDGMFVGSQTAAAATPSQRDHLGVGRLCACLVDELVVSSSPSPAFAENLYGAAAAPARPGGPAWSKPRLHTADINVPPYDQPGYTACEATGTCQANDPPYAETALCMTDVDRLCLSANAAPVLVGEIAPYSHAAPNQGAHQFTLLDPEGDPAQIRVVAINAGGGNMESQGLTTPAYTTVTAGQTAATTADAALAFQLRTAAAGGIPDGRATYVTVELTDDADGDATFGSAGDHTRQITLGFHNGTVAYGVDVEQPQIVVGQADVAEGGVTIAAKVIGNGGQALDGVTVTFDDTTSCAGPNGVVAADDGNLPGGPVTAVSSGGVAEQTLSTLTAAGRYCVQVSVPSGGATPSVHTDVVEVVVKQTAGSIAIHDATVKQGADVPITVTARDRVGSPYAGAVVRATVTGAGNADAVIVASNPPCVTSAAGTCDLTIVADDGARVGTYQLTARSGSETASSQITVDADVQQIRVFDVSVPQGGSRTVDAFAVTADAATGAAGGPVAGVDLRALSNNASIGIGHGNGTACVPAAANPCSVVTTAADGRLTIDVRPAIDADPSPATPHTITFTVPGSGVSNTIRVFVTAAIQPGTGAAGSGGIALDPAGTLAVGSVAAVTGRVTTDTGAGVPNATVGVEVIEPTGSTGAGNVRVPARVRANSDGTLLVPVTIGGNAPVGQTFGVRVFDPAAPNDTFDTVTFTTANTIGRVDVTGWLQQYDGALTDAAAQRTLFLSVYDAQGRPDETATVEVVRLRAVDGTEQGYADGSGTGNFTATTGVQATDPAATAMTATTADNTSEPSAAASVRVEGAVSAITAGPYLLEVLVDRDAGGPEAATTVIVPVHVRSTIDPARTRLESTSVQQVSAGTIRAVVIDIAGDPVAGVQVVVDAAEADPGDAPYAAANDTVVVVGADAANTAPTRARAITRADGIARVPVRALDAEARYPNAPARADSSATPTAWDDLLTLTVIDPVTGADIVPTTATADVIVTPKVRTIAVADVGDTLNGQQAAPAGGSTLVRIIAVDIRGNRVSGVAVDLAAVYDSYDPDGCSPSDGATIVAQPERARAATGADGSVTVRYTIAAGTAGTYGDAVCVRTGSLRSTGTMTVS